MIEGTRIGAYDVGAKIGAGGMGEVYRAVDTRLGRHVAIKVLPPALAQDPERLARFDREARTLATLNHPNIAAIHGLEEAGGIKALVMELVEGPTLADRLAAGAVPLDESLAIARQIADALAAAHEQGIVHRDLKPANVKVREDGTVKVLDFGLAKALEPVVSGAAAGTSASISPTITSPAMTMAGMILGTAAYMSPEQARGKAVDRRADIWSFGCVLFEMLTGQRAFEDEDVSLTLSKVLQREPEFAALPSEVPPHIVQTLRVCLRKDPRARISDIQDVRLALDGVFHSTAPAAVVREPAPSRIANRLGWGFAAAAVMVAAAALFGWWQASRRSDERMTIIGGDLGPDAARAPRDSLALSNDGTRMVFVGRDTDGGNQQLFLRRLDRDEAAKPLLGTWLGPDINMPFFAPPGQGEWIAFFANQTLNRVPSDGGTVETIATLESLAIGGSWSEDGTIYFGTVSGLHKVPAGGGMPELVAGGRAKGFPVVLPGGDVVLINEAPLSPTSLDDVSINAFIVRTGEVKPLGLVGYAPRYLPTSGRQGHVIYVSKGTLYGVGFDPERVEVLGKPERLFDNVGDPDLQQGGGHFVTSANGTLAYLTGRSQAPQRLMVWLDPTGKTTPLMPRPESYVSPRLSPNNRLFAYTMQGPGGGNVWVGDLKTQTPMQLTFTNPGVREVAWAPDGEHLVFGDGVSLWWIKADGSVPPLKILEKSANPRPFSFTRDGRLAYTFIGPAGPPDIATLRLDLTDPDHPTAAAPEPFLTKDYAEVDPAFSPDGRFLAFSSFQNNTNDVYVTTFPSGAGNWRVSTNSGRFPVWTARELFFLGADDRIMFVPYTIRGDTFTWDGDPRPWSPTPVLRDGTRQNFDMTMDGRRAVVFPRPAAVQENENLHAVFVMNFFDEVRRRIPIP